MFFSPSSIGRAFLLGDSMDDIQKSLYIARLISGQQRFKYENKWYTLKNPTPEQLLVLEEYLSVIRQEMVDFGVLDRKELLKILYEQGMWSTDEEKSLREHKKQIEDLKITLFEQRYKSVQQQITRNNLKVFNEELDRLNDKKYSFDNLSLEGNLFATRMRILFGMCIYISKGETYWKDQDDFSEWDVFDPVLDALFVSFVKSKISPKEIRTIARTDPWTNYWSIKGLSKDGLFHDSILCLSDEQRNLISWSNTYEFISNLQGADKLSDFIVNDDDMLDGWILLYNKSTTKESYGTDNFGKGDEVYVPVDTMEDAKRIHEMNDPIAKAQIREDMAAIDKAGRLDEMYRPTYQKKHNAAYAEAARLKGVI